MQNSRLLKLIKKLSKKEQKRLMLFLVSPFYNKRQEVSSLFQYINESIRIKTRNLSKQEVFAHIAPKQVYNDQQMRLWMSWLYKLIEQFLVLEAFSKNGVAQDLILCKVYRSRQLDEHFNRQLRRTRDTLSDIEIHDANYYTQTYSLELEAYQHQRNKGRMEELNLQEMSDDLDVAYLANKLHHACIALSHQAIYKTEYTIGLLPEILSYIKRHQLVSHPPIALYFSAYQMLSHPSPNHFSHFKELLFEKGHFFSEDELGDLYLIAINFCIKQYNQGEQLYLRGQLELYRQGLKRALFYQNQRLSRFTYRNIVTIGLILAEYEWVEQFIQEYRPRLANEHRESMSSFCLACLAYSRKSYDEAIVLLQRANYRDLLLNLAAKAVSLKIYYELDESDLLQAHLDAMQQFIRRKEKLVYHQNHYLQLIQFTRRLHELAPYDQVTKQQLQEEVENTKEVAEKRWLLQQLA